MKLEGQTAIVTGGCSGLGLATAKLLVTKGVKVIIMDIERKLGKSIVEELGEEKVHFQEVDITQDDEVREGIEAAVEKFGSIRIFVNCAGIVHAESVATQSKVHSSTAFRRVVNLNLLGTQAFENCRFYMSKYAAWHIKSLESVEGERGIIINVASVAAEDGQSGQVAYSASKAAIMGMTLPMSRDLGKFGIRIVTISPGPFATPLEKEAISEKIVQGISRTIALGRLGKVSLRQQSQPEQFANLVAAIVENSYLSGVTIRLDGGLRVPHI